MMTPQQIVTEMSRTICRNFIDHRQPTRRHDLVVKFEVTDLLSEMETRGLCRSRNNQKEYLPSSGSFAMLGPDDELYQMAEKVFVTVAQILRGLFIAEGAGKQYSAIELEQKTSALTADQFELGLYLCSDFGILGSSNPSIDGLTVGPVTVSENIVRMKTPEKDWNDRGELARALFRPKTLVPSEYLQSALDEEDFGDFGEFGNHDGQETFWGLLHPSIIPSSRRRFRSGLFAEAVEAALKVVAGEIRTRTGLDLDGVPLMNKAFSPDNPLLLFDPSGSVTGRSMQEGYHRMFVGTIMAVRNPKAHGFVEIDATRCIHFLYLASLLAFKVDEAQIANAREEVRTGEDSLPTRGKAR